MKKTFFSLITVVALLFVFGNVYSQDYLEGYVKVSDLQKEPYNQWFTENYKTAHPNDAILSKIRPLLENKKITVVFGTWCGDSQLWVPYFIRMVDLMGYDTDNITFIAIDRDKEAENIDLSKYKIERIPTFIVYDEDGKELGRIVETPKYSLEEDLLDILSNAKE